jgi:antitoxin HicB
MMSSYYALFEADREAGGYVVTFPDLGHGATQGESLVEAGTLAVELLEGILGEMMKRGDVLPVPNKLRSRQYRLVDLPALQAAKVELYRAFKKSRITKAELARRVGIAKPNVERLFDLDHASRLDQIEAAFAALGKKLEVSVRNAAA